MRHFRKILLAFCVLWGTGLNASTHEQLSDSLQQALAQTADPRQRVALLLNLKDLNEDSNLNLAYSIQLFREAAAVRDTYAMTMATVPILAQYAPPIPKKRIRSTATSATCGN